MRRIMAATIGLFLPLSLAPAHAQSSSWQSSNTVPRVLPWTESPVSLGHPEPLAQLGVPTPLESESGPQITQVGYQAPNPLVSSLALASQAPAGQPIPGPGGLPAIGVQSPGEQYNCGVVNQPPGAGGHPWFGNNGVFGFGTFQCSTRKLFQSDHEFDNFISPVSNPFYFEDPRSLTEVRPIFIYQAIPNLNPISRGGDQFFFGLQGRLAITERFSIVLHKLGGVYNNYDISPLTPPEIAADFPDRGGFAEVWVGPKYTFLRSDTTGTLGAVGLIFQVAIGSSQTQQDTGDLSLAPYISIGQAFGKTSYGEFHALGTLGYSVAMDNQRNDMVYSSLHLDYDIGNLHRFYPLLEMNYYGYTSDGGAVSNGVPRALGFEGLDIANYGSTFLDHQRNNLTIAGGLRVKLTDKISTGLVAETPVTPHHGIEDFRITFDLIFRY